MSVPVVLVGIIPTRMGTSMQKLIRNSGVRDHPHAYGDKYSLAFPGFPELGSSPRVWGQAVRQAQSCHMNRIIPTRMGTSSYLYLLPIGLKDHPHAYGDKTKLSYRFHIGAGSSPRVWGQVPVRAGQCQHYRIIPTRVGTRYGRNCRSDSDRDHPHACGDKTFWNVC